MKKSTLIMLTLATLTFAGDFTNSIGMKFKDIPAGTFTMGTPTASTTDCPKNNPFTKLNEYDECVSSRTGSVDPSETPARRSSVGSFYLGETEVTQGQWYELMGKNPAHFQNGNPNMPVESVSWNDAKEFIIRLNQKEGTDKYRLPTEKEWEYAARAGTTTKWYCGDNESCLSSITNLGKINHPVATKKPNNFGLYDMIGNVWEWTDSCYTKNYNSGCHENWKVCRGGRSAVRSQTPPKGCYSDVGFRLLRTK